MIRRIVAEIEQQLVLRFVIDVDFEKPKMSRQEARVKAIAFWDANPYFPQLSSLLTSNFSSQEMRERNPFTCFVEAAGVLSKRRRQWRHRRSHGGFTVVRVGDNNHKKRSLDLKIQTATTVWRHTLHEEVKSRTVVSRAVIWCEMRSRPQPNLLRLRHIIYSSGCMVLKNRVVKQYHRQTSIEDCLPAEGTMPAIIGETQWCLDNFDSAKESSSSYHVGRWPFDRREGRWKSSKSFQALSFYSSLILVSTKPLFHHFSLCQIPFCVWRFNHRHWLLFNR